MEANDFTRRAALGLAVGATAAAATEANATVPAVTSRERVLGIGGFFFRARDPEGLARWYEANLGIAPSPTSYDAQPWRTEAGVTIFAPFPETTRQFGDPSRQWMMNFRVRDLEAMAAQLRANQIAVVIDPQLYPNGRFASLQDPEGNPIQLWQPSRS